MKYLDRLAGRIYLILLVATGYPEQEPEYGSAKWYDLFWLLIPIIGWLLFVLIIEGRE